MGMLPQALYSVIQLILSYLHVSTDLILRRFIITMAAALSTSVYVSLNHTAEKLLVTLSLYSNLCLTCFLKQQVDAVAGVTLITIHLMENIMFSKEIATMCWSEKSFQDTISVSMLKTIIAMLQIILLVRSM